MQRGQLEGVPLDATEATYTSMLRSVGEEVQLGQLEDAPIQVNAEEQMVIVYQVDEEDDGQLARKRRAVNSRAGPKQKAKRDWVQLLCPALHDGDSGELGQVGELGQADQVVVNAWGCQ